MISHDRDFLKRLKFFQKNNIAENVIDLAHFDKVKLDQDKIYAYRQGLIRGIENYSLFQNFVTFKWPAWLHNSAVVDTTEYRPLSPPLLFNNSLRDGICFASSFSGSEIFIDPSGMISPSYDTWSVEIWLSNGSQIIRPAENLKVLSLRRNQETSITTVRWPEKNCDVEQEIIGARIHIDEALVRLSAHLKKGSKKYTLFIVVRPYNTFMIGGVSDIIYNEDGVLSINGYKRLALTDKPDVVLGGDGLKGDIDINRYEDCHTVTCTGGMATMALGYRLSTGKNDFIFRLSLDASRDIHAESIDYPVLLEDFTSSAKKKSKRGFNITVNDSIFGSWFYGSKVSLLNITENDLYREHDRSQLDFRASFFMILGLNRMGYQERAEEILELMFSHVDVSDKDCSFGDLIHICYLFNAFNEIYLHKRDMPYLQDRYPVLKKRALLLLKYSNTIKKNGDVDLNSIELNFSKSGHSFDLILIASALSNFSYLSRSMGIFGDESHFQQESARIAQLFLDDVLENETGMTRVDDFFCYNACAVFPFSLSQMDEHNTARLFKIILSHYPELPLKVHSLGWDMVSTFIFVNCMIQMKDERVWDQLNSLNKLGEKRYSLSDYINPHTKRGCWGRGGSKVLSSVIFSTLRNMLYTDFQERLEIFPLPRPEWFKAGTEIVIRDAPSRFGNLNLRIVTTTNEVHFNFEDLPKYVPPDIRINLPFKAKIIKEDDFLIKKESADSFLLNGWPARVRFIKK